MALKNIFDIIRADRYTADGREEIIKAQEADVEDRRYNIGEISEKTGLQKTANGWVKPKNGKQPAAASKRDTDPQTYIVKKNDELRSMFQKEKDPAKKSAMKKALQKQANMMEPEPFSSTESKPAADRPSHEQAYLDAFKDEKLKSDVKAAIKKYGATGNNLRNALYKNDKELSDKLEKMQPDFANQFIAEMQRESKPADEKAKMEDVRKQLLELEKQRRSYKDDTAENYAGHNIRLKQAALLRQAGFNGRSDFDKYLREKMPTDSAPRILTGDTRIRVRKA